MKAQNFELKVDTCCLTQYSISHCEIIRRFSRMYRYIVAPKYSTGTGRQVDLINEQKS